MGCYHWGEGDALGIAWVKARALYLTSPRAQDAPHPTPPTHSRGMTLLQMPEVLQENPVQGRPAPPQCPTVMTDPNAVTSRAPPDSIENFNAAQVLGWAQVEPSVEATRHLLEPFWEPRGSWRPSSAIMLWPGCQGWGWPLCPQSHGLAPGPGCLVCQALGEPLVCTTDGTIPPELTVSCVTWERGQAGACLPQAPRA